MKSFVAASLALALLCVQGFAQQPPPAAQQPPPPVFRVEVDAVEIDAFVTDAQGNPVTDLTAEDFEVLEDNRRQAITSFSLINIPLERAERPLYSPTAIEPDVYTNRGGEGRIYVIALDEVRPDLALRTRHFMRRFIERNFGANDVAAIVNVGRGRASDAQDFTSSQRLLLNAIDKYSGGFSQEPLPAAGGNEAAQAATDAFAQSRASEAQFLDRARMRSLRDLLEFMGGLRGRRKAMIYVTERLGDVFSVLDYNGGARSIAFDDLHKAMTAATRGNVSIYPVDPRGLSPDGGLGADEVAPAAPGAEGLARVQELRAFAEATGGFALVNSNNFEQAFERIVRENSTYYVLGFTSTNERRDGRYRRIQVRVRRPGLQVRARNGYVAPMGRAPRPGPPDATMAGLSTSVAEAVRVPMGNPSVPMSVSAVPLKGNGRDGSVAIAVEFDASRLDLMNTGTAATGELELTAVAVGIDGKTHTGERQRARLNLRPETYERALESGVRMLTQISLPPGRYQLRVAGGNVAGRAGSVMVDLEVPDFTREPLMISGVALTSQSTSGMFTAAQKDPLAGLLPGPATATREFARGERVALYAEIYENRRDRAAHTVSLKAELRSDEGRVLQTVEEERKSAELEGNTGGYGFRAEIPLDAEPGLYVIHVEARANISGQPTASRDIQIRVK